ncbi:hypothetical protein [Telmatospirillum sp. J64-1]|uniref:hypothetical protein n=1 Tax=Telmatospirillum sp. J64-1 TaxID=2502183 RepID=UPI00115D9A3A|nr:hypothetical protein [Telmatospirillum sp. J64-1]
MKLDRHIPPFDAGTLAELQRLEVDLQTALSRLRLIRGGADGKSRPGDTASLDVTADDDRG